MTAHRAPALLTLLLVLPAIHLAAGASIGTCTGSGALALGLLEVTGGHGISVYVDDRGAPLGNGAWIYQETNGLYMDRAPGVYQGSTVLNDLQRGGRSSLVPSDGEICTDDSA